MEKVRVLVVDDETDIKVDLCRDLIKEGYEAVGASDAIEGLSLMVEPFPVVIADLRMPKMDGLDFIRAIQDKNPRTQVIIITGHGGEKDAIEAVRLHVFDYITKGELTVDRLLDSIKRAVIKYEALPSLRNWPSQLRGWAKSDETIKDIREITSDIEGTMGEDISQQRG